MKSDHYLRALSHIAWAYIFLLLNISIGNNSVNINLLPAWIGWLLIFQALPEIEKQERTAVLLRPVATLLGIWDAVCWITSVFTGNSLSLPLLQLIISSLNLYFHFQFFTDLASAAKSHGLTNHCRRMLRMRTFATIYNAVITVLSFVWPLDLFSGISLFLVTGVTLFLIVWILATLFSFRNAEERRIFRMGRPQE